MKQNRANKHKIKLKSCSMCKPHKMGWERNLKNKEFAKYKNDVKEANE